MRKLLCILVVAMIVLSLVGCKNSEKDPITTSDTTIEIEENPFEEFFEITWLTILSEDYKEGRWDELELEAIFNVDLQVWPMNSLNSETMAALVAAGDIADYWFAPACPRQPDSMYAEGLSRSIPLSMIKSSLPGMYKILEMVPIGFKYNLVEGTTDEYLGITHIGFGAAQYFYDSTAVNLDWLEAIGYGIEESTLFPVKIPIEGYEDWSDKIFFTEGNFSFTDLNNILREFTENDPDGNGQDDTFGMLYLPEVQEGNNTQEGLFGFVTEQQYLYKDPVTGDIVPKWAYTPYRDYLNWISDSLSKGYIRMLPGEQSWSLEWRAITSTNKVGIMQIHRDTYLNPVSNAAYPPHNVLLESNPDARFVIGMMFSGPDGKKVNRTYTPDIYSGGTWGVDLIGKQVSDEKLKRILSIFEYTLYNSEDTFLRYNVGIEGIHWKWSGEPYRSAKLLTPANDLPEQYRGMVRVFTGNLLQWPLSGTEAYNAENNGYWSLPAYMYVHDLYEKYALVPAKYLSRIYMGSELHDNYLEINNDAWPQMSPIINDFKNRALNGQIANFNSEWEQYISQLYAAGLQQLVDEIFNNPEFRAYDRGDIFKPKFPMY